jgi:hypothetical protein
MRHAIDLQAVYEEDLPSPERAVAAPPEAVEDDGDEGSVQPVLHGGRQRMRVVMLHCERLRAEGGGDLARQPRTDVARVEIVDYAVGTYAALAAEAPRAAEGGVRRRRRFQISDVDVEHDLRADGEGRGALEVAAQGEYAGGVRRAQHERRRGLQHERRRCPRQPQRDGSHGARATPIVAGSGPRHDHG